MPNNVQYKHNQLIMEGLRVRNRLVSLAAVVVASGAVVASLHGHDAAVKDQAHVNTAKTVAVASATPAPTATPSVPVQCTGTYTNTIQAGNGQSVNGTAANDLIVVGSQNSVDGAGGDDCIVTDGTGNSLHGGLGNDTFVLNGASNTAFGGAGNDTFWAVAGNSLKGDEDNDTLQAPGASTLDGGLGVDTCKYTAGVGSVKNCENKLTF